MRKLLPELREGRCRRRGNPLNPEQSRLVAKVCEEEGKGELLLGAFPTSQRMDVITKTEHDIQMYCFAKTQQQCGWSRAVKQECASLEH